MADRKRPRRVRAHELDVGPLPLADFRPAVVLACRQRLLQRPVKSSVGLREVDEARTSDARLGCHNIRCIDLAFLRQLGLRFYGSSGTDAELGELVQDQLGYLPRLLLLRLREAHGDVAGEMTVRFVLRLLQDDLWLRRNLALGHKFVESLVEGLLDFLSCHNRLHSFRIPFGRVPDGARLAVASGASPWFAVPPSALEPRQGRLNHRVGSASIAPEGALMLPATLVHGLAPEATPRRP